MKPSLSFVGRVLCALLLAGCRNSVPAEPSLRRAAPAPQPPSEERYRPPIEESARRIAAAAAVDGGASGVPERSVRLDVPAPSSVDVVATRVGARWLVGAVERDRVTLGMAGAERIFNLLNDARHPPTAVELARIVGALHYYPWRVYDGSSWSHTGENTPPTPAPHVPHFVDRPGGTGRALIFAYWVPEGTPGAGMHLANIHVTDSGLLIDAAPMPGR